MVKNLEKELNLKELSNLSQDQLLQMYNDDYIPETQEKNSVFYYVREPHISINMQNNLKMVQDYIRYLKCLEGVSDRIRLQSFGFDSFFVLDGFFEVPVSYHDIFEVSTSDKKLRTIYKF
jgi:hypothetical protein